ncbi:MAG: hypothetical protein ABMB14_21665, partial [Myxococcota bacterium]
MIDKPLRWRLGSRERSKGRYWWMETGRAEDRLSLTLGFITEEEASTALATMNREEERTIGTPYYRRILRRHETDPDGVLTYLLRGEAAHEPFGMEPTDYGALPL